jgi:glutaredoxin
MQPEVVIYTTPTCQYCPAAKRWLEDHGVVYTEYDVSRDPTRAAEMYRLTGQGSVPVIRVGGQVMVGFDPLQLAKLLPNAGNGNGTGAGANEKVSLGMAAQSLTQETADELGLPAPFGVVVGPVRPGGPADVGGLREGDVLTGIGSYTLQNLGQLQSVVAAKRPGDSISLVAWRDGDERDVTVEFPPTQSQPASQTGVPTPAQAGPPQDGGPGSAAPEAAAPPAG